MAQRLVEASPPTHNEVEELAVAEGHDADIPTNLGVLDHSEKSSVTSKHMLNVDHRIDLEKNVDSSKGTSLSEETVEETAAQGEQEDPDIVWWDGPDDNQNPMNWSPARKWGAVVIVSVITLLTSLASSMFAPGIPRVMRDFNSDNDMLASFVVSVFVLGFAFGPLGEFIRCPRASLELRLTCCSSCCAPFGDVRPSTIVPRLQRPVHHLYCCLRREQQSEHADRFPLSIRSCRRCAAGSGRWYDSGLDV